MVPPPVHHRAVPPSAPNRLPPDLVELAGAAAICDRAGRHLAAGDPLRAIHLGGEIVLETDPPEHQAARVVVRSAHEALLAGSDNFWESAWLRKQIGELP